MLRIGMLVVAMASAGCGGGSAGFSCSSAETSLDHFWGTQVSCTRGSGSNAMVFGRGSFSVDNCNAYLPECSAADRTKAATYFSCVAAAPPCTAGNESAAIDALLACAGPFNSVSLACFPAFM